MKREYKERRLYFYTCEVCHTPNRCSFKRSRVKGGVCKKCRSIEVNKDQGRLFPEV